MGIIGKKQPDPEKVMAAAREADAKEAAAARQRLLDQNRLLAQAEKDRARAAAKLHPRLDGNQ